MNNNTTIVGSDGRETPSLDYPPSYPYRCDCGAFVIEWDGEAFDAMYPTQKHSCVFAALDRHVRGPTVREILDDGMFDTP